MNTISDRDLYVYKLWDSGHTYQSISKQDIPSYLSLQRIRNIVYDVGRTLNTPHQKAIYKTFLIAFQRLKNVSQAIHYTHQHQPPHRLSPSQIRRIVSKVQKSNIK